MKTKAQQSILYYITTFCIAYKFEGTKGTIGLSSDSYFKAEGEPREGDLVVLKGARQSRWYLSWYISCEKKDNCFNDSHLIESVETGELCNWSNVSFSILNRKIVDEHPEWRWTDKQWEFQEKWFRACYKYRDAYINLPCYPDFKEDGSVVLTIRKRFNFGEPTSKTFESWKKLLTRDMTKWYDEVDKK